MTKQIDPLLRETLFQYDVRDQVTKVTDALLEETTFAYDADGNRLSITDPLGRTTAYSYDVMDRLLTVTQPDPGAGAPVWTIDYDNLGRVIEQTDPLANITAMDYDIRNRLVTLTEPDPDGTGSAASPTWQFTYNAAGDQLSQTGPLGRVITRQFDAWGRMTEQSLPAVTDSNNQLLSDGTFNFTYDDEGNRTSRTKIATGEVTEYSWDHRNRLVQVVEKDSQGQVTKTVDYTYDVFDRRIAKSVTPAVGPAHIEQFIYDGPHIALRFENGNLASRYLHGPATDQIQ